MTLTLTFTDDELLDGALIAPDSTVYYTTSTAQGALGRKTTTITAASGLVGLIKWREHAFVINGVQRKWKELKEQSNGTLSSEREWRWGKTFYKLKYNPSHRELVATPILRDGADAVRFTPRKGQLFQADEKPAIHFPHEMQDEIERIFLLMAILYTEMPGGLLW